MVQLASVKKTATNRTNAIGNFYVDKIDGEVMRAFLVEHKIPGDSVDPDGEDEQLAVRLSLFFKEQLEKGACKELFQCEICNGETPDTYDTCPLCGNGGVILESDAPANDPTEIDASKMNPDLVESSPTSTTNKKKKNNGTTRPEDAPQRDVDPPPADPKANKETTMPAAAAAATTNGASKKSSSKKTSVAATSTALATTKKGAVATVRSASDLDAAVQRVEALKGDTARSYWVLGRELHDINENKLWKLRVDENGKARYTGWDSFVTHELKMSAPHSYDLIKLAQNFTEDQVRLWGKTKLALVLKAPPEMRDQLVSEVAAGASKRQIADKVQKAREKTGHTSPKKQQAKAGKASAKKAAAKRAKVNNDKITIASIEGRKTFKFFAKPDSMKNVDMKTLKRAKTIDANPFARIELANEVVMYVYLKKTENGLEGAYDIRREVESDE